MRSALGEHGLIAEVFDDVSDAPVPPTPEGAAQAAQGQLSLAVFVDDLAVKAANARRSLQEGQIRLVRGVFRRDHGQ